MTLPASTALDFKPGELGVMGEHSYTKGPQLEDLKMQLYIKSKFCPNKPGSMPRIDRVNFKFNEY